MSFVEITCPYMYPGMYESSCHYSAVVGEINEDKDKTIDFSRVKADSLKQVRHQPSKN